MTMMLSFFTSDTAESILYINVYQLDINITYNMEQMVGSHW